MTNIANDRLSNTIALGKSKGAFGIHTPKYKGTNIINAKSRYLIISFELAVKPIHRFLFIKSF